ncbi:MAG: hypothetical protein R2704_04220 [Microthrixaceae bacterium]
MLCRRGGPSPCAACVEALRPLANGELSPPPDGVDGAAALCRYEGVATGLVTSLKYHRHRDAVDSIGAALAVMGGPWFEGATVCWVPAEPSKAASRGFDQGRLLARAAARAAAKRLHSRVPVAALLHRTASAPTMGKSSGAPARPVAAGQTGRTRAQRLEGPRFDHHGRRPPGWW